MNESTYAVEILMQRGLALRFDESGRLIDPPHEAFGLRDLAVSLSRQCRYRGHTRRFYSVAEHCIHLSEWLGAHFRSPRLALYGLLHDAGEVAISDIPWGLKKHCGAMPKAMEDSVLHEFLALNGLEWPVPSSVKSADSRITIDEIETLMPEHGLTESVAARVRAEGLRPLGWRVQEGIRNGIGDGSCEAVAEDFHRRAMALSGRGFGEATALPSAASNSFATSRRGAA